jgi:hypothetical protein
MKTFIFADKNSSATIILDAEDYEDALSELNEVVINPTNFRYDSQEEEEFINQ